jgi:hypothetical protein
VGAFFHPYPLAHPPNVLHNPRSVHRIRSINERNNMFGLPIIVAFILIPAAFHIYRTLKNNRHSCGM